MKFLTIPMLALPLIACTTATPIRGANGERQIFIECDSIGLSFCYEKAQEVCPGGYRTVSVTNEAQPRLLLDPVYTRNITVECS